MVNKILDIFVKNNKEVDNPKVREKVGTMSSFLGIFCNVLLFISKFLMGTLSNSVAIVSDSFNNLSDCLSCVITLASYKLAARPADKDHPFGHGRIEYLSSLVIACIIGFVGIEFFKTSVGKIFNPDQVVFRWVTIITLLISIIVKMIMGHINNSLGKMYSSPTMLATAQDSFSDCITTFVTIVGLVAATFTSLPVDGIIGSVVSFLILKSAYGILKETTDTLLGMPADEETINKIKNIVLEHHQILGIHDLIVHNYGPGKIMATLHAEIDSKSNIMEAHEIIDDIERDLYDKLHIITTIHMDPLDLENRDLKEYKNFIDKVVSEIDSELTIHDFRIVPGEKHTNVLFDIVITDKYRNKTDLLNKMIEYKVKKVYPQINIVITFDNQY